MSRLGVSPSLHAIRIPPSILARGFWLYLWRIVGPRNDAFGYVGMTGDVTGVAQSPFARAGSHFGSNKNANAIRRHLEAKHILPEQCSDFRFLVYGPILPYWHSVPRHPDFDNSRRSVAALERRLWQYAEDCGLKMLNRKPGSRAPLDEVIWQDVESAFSPYLCGDTDEQ